MPSIRVFWNSLQIQNECEFSETHGKAIVSGEHAVLYGSHAVAIPVSSMSIKLSISTASYENQSFKENTDFSFIEDVVKDAAELLSLDLPDLDISAQSNFIVGVGIGASASLCVCVLRALANAFKMTLDRKTLAKLANSLEARFHGTPSGLDTAVVSYAQPILFSRSQGTSVIQVSPIQHHDQSIPWQFALVDSQTRSSTLEMIKHARPYFQSKEGEDAVKAIDQNSVHIANALEAGEFSVVKDAIQSTGSYLTKARLIPPALEALMKEANRCGVSASKVTGAGGGGCILCLLPVVEGFKVLERLNQSFPGRVYPITLP